MRVEPRRDQHQVRTELREHRNDDLREHEAVVLVHGAGFERHVDGKACALAVPISSAAPVPG